MKLSTGKIIFLVVALIVLFFCGKNIFKDTKGMINELKSQTVVCEEATLNSENDGKFVLVTGKVEVNEAKDDLFNVTVKTPSLKRDVEMYQYKVGMNDVIEYEWSNPNGEIMKDSEGYDMKDSRGIVLRNPSTSLKDDYFKAAGKVGDFNIDEDIFSNISAENKTYEKENEEVIMYEGQKFYFVDGYFNTCRDAGREIVGDLRVKYTYKDLDNVEYVTVLAKQEGSKLTFGETSDNTKVGYIAQGKTSLDNVLSNIQKSENSGKTGAIIIALIVLVIGFFVFKKKETK